jgi:hypothetical protein
VCWTGVGGLVDQLPTVWIARHSNLDGRCCPPPPAAAGPSGRSSDRATQLLEPGAAAIGRRVDSTSARARRGRSGGVPTLPSVSPLVASRGNRAPGGHKGLSTLETRAGSPSHPIRRGVEREADLSEAQERRKGPRERGNRTCLFFPKKTPGNIPLPVASCHTPTRLRQIAPHAGRLRVSSRAEQPSR